MNDRTFELEGKDCAIIIKENMSTEVIIPKLAEDQNVTWEDNQNMFITIAISASMGQADFREVITKKLDEIMAQAVPATRCGTEETGCPGSCPGGCAGSAPQDVPAVEK